MRDQEGAMRDQEGAMRDQEGAMDGQDDAMDGREGDRELKLGALEAPSRVLDCVRGASELPQGAKPMTTPATTPIPVLVTRARTVLRLSNVDYGRLLGLSERTMSRHRGNPPLSSPRQLHALARAVHPRDRSLAEELASAGQTTLIELGLEKVQPQPRPLVVDSVLCVAAETLGVAPSAVRPMLHAAFQRARLLGLALEEVEQGLAPPETAKPASPRK